MEQTASWEQLLTKFNQWLSEARVAYENCHKKAPEFFVTGEVLPHAMALATASADGRPRVRQVLMKDINEQGMSFYTNYDSDKGFHIKENNRVSCLFFWPTQFRQVRIEGIVEKVSRQESENYWKTRHRLSQISGTVSPQSRTIESFESLKMAAAKLAQDHPGNLPCPPNWGGYRVSVLEIEFWQGDFHRLHKRECYQRTNINDLFQLKILGP